MTHRLFSYITINWRGKPLHSLQTVVNLIPSSTVQRAFWPVEAPFLAF
ncbi:MAG: ISAzo13-like element transposase-related protein [Nocardioidaceae bacterium]